MLDDLVKEYEIEKLGTITRWHTHKILIRNAAETIRALTINTNPTTDFEKKQFFVSLARVVWESSCCVATNMLKRSAIAKEHIQVRDGRVSLLDSVAFNEQISARVNNCIEKEVSDLSDTAGPSHSAV